MARAEGAGQAIQLLPQIHQRLQLLLAQRLVSHCTPALYVTVRQALRVGATLEQRHLMVEFFSQKVYFGRGRGSVGHRYRKQPCDGVGATRELLVTSLVVLVDVQLV